MQLISSKLVGEGVISEGEIERYCEFALDASYVYMWPMMLATWGRKARK
jgi:hypothetical protein